MATERYYSRFAEPLLNEALADTPVVLIHGPRQCGKTTLARRLGARAGCAYKSFDDEVTLAAARSDPIGFVADLPAKCILDEVQRALDVPHQRRALLFARVRVGAAVRPRKYSGISWRNTWRNSFSVTGWSLSERYFRSASFTMV